jgi:hypothetical protein
VSNRVLIPWRKEAYLGGGCGTLNGILAFDSFNPFCFMIDDALNLRLVETVYDGVFALRDMDYTVCDDKSGSLFPMLRRGTHCVSPKMCRAQLDELFGTNSAACILSCRYEKTPVLQPYLPFSSCNACTSVAYLS